jgi:hypothetical protein
MGFTMRPSIDLKPSVIHRDSWRRGMWQDTYFASRHGAILSLLEDSIQAIPVLLIPVELRSVIS